MSSLFAARSLPAFGRSLRLRARPLPLMTLLFACALAAGAQIPGPRVRLTQAIVSSQTVTLPGNVHPLARPEFDQGVAPNDLPMNRMLLVLKRTPEQEQDLQQLLADQQQPGSSSYHQWLTPQQFGARFGVAAADIATVSGWLASSGFTVNQVAAGANVIEFSGTAGQVSTAFHTSMHRYVVNGVEHWANATNPQIPAALAPVVGGTVSLNNFSKHTGHLQAQGTSALVQPGTPVPSLTYGTGSHALVPGDFATIYNANALYNAPTPINGSGQTIAVVGRTNVNLSDISDFRSLFLPAYPAQPVTVLLNGPDPGNLLGDEEGEADLDLEWSSGIAPKAAVSFVVSASTNTTDGVDLSQEYILNNNVAPVMTTSFSACEADLGTQELTFLSEIAEQAAAQGITVVNSSGDSGAAECDADTNSVAVDGLAVNGLATTAYTTAVGGTQFNEGSGSYWTATASTSATNYTSALSYIPETTWNESAGGTLFASGGGVSLVTAKPLWQANVTGIPNDGARDIPDVAFAAGGKEGYVVCQDRACKPSGGSFGFSVFGGTSASGPAFAGVMAMVNQKLNSVQGVANVALYRIAAAETWSACNAATGTPASLAGCVFLDTTTGNNSVPGVTGYTAGVGYDQATGLGSMNIANLVNAWNTLTPLQPTTATITSLNPTTFVHGSTVTFQAQVVRTGATGLGISGDLGLIAETTTPVQAGGNGFGVDFFTLGTGCTTAGCVKATENGLPGGTYPVVVRYGGDTNFAPSTSAPITVTVTPEGSTTQVCACVLDSSGNASVVASVPYGTFLYPQAYVAGNAQATLNVFDGIPTGLVTFTDNSAPLQVPGYSNAIALNSEEIAAFPNGVTTLAVGSHSLIASYPGDASFSPSVSAAAALTVTTAPTATNLVSATVTGSAVGMAVTVVPTSGSLGNPPTGTVTFFSGTTQLGTPVTVSPVTDPNTGLVSASASLTAAVPNGQNSLTAKYAGDANYTTSTSTATVVTVGAVGGAFNLAATPATVTLNSGAAATYNLTVTPNGGFTGTVALTCAFATTTPAVAAGCTVAPASLALSGSAAGAASVTVTTTQHNWMVPPPDEQFPRSFWWLLGLLCATGLALLGWRAPRRAVLPWALAGLIALTAVGCGGGGGSGSTTVTPFGTQAGSYTIVVTGTAGTTTASQSLALLVN